MKVHWCGTGLSAIPGLRYLIDSGADVVVWNRSLDKAKGALLGCDVTINAFDQGALAQTLRPGDVVVSMLPASFHIPLATLALETGAHFVSSSYIAPQMKKLGPRAKAAQLCFVNEVGLDPGLDHLMAHDLIARYRANALDKSLDLSFYSFCGGFPAKPNPFCYKFSWSPLGVLNALRSPSVSIRDFALFNVEQPWLAVEPFEVPLAVPESFEAYPNRDSRPFLGEYGFETNWSIRNFVRGTLRLDGWSDAWGDIFKTLEKFTHGKGESELAALSEQLWQKHRYEPDEPDRVVLCVGLEAQREGQTVWHQAHVLDAYGDARGSAMARLVSFPVAFAVEAVVAGQIAPGVSAAPSDPMLVFEWLSKISDLAQEMRLVDRLGG